MSVLLAAASNMSLAIAGTLNQTRNKPGTTLMSWMYANTFANSENYLLGFGRNGSTTQARHTLSARSSGVFRTTCRRLDSDSSTILDTTEGTAVTGSWLHVASVADWTNGQLIVYINGESSISTAPAGWNGNTSDTDASNGAVGVRGDLLNSTDWDGYLEDVRVYSRALTADEIRDIYTSKGKDGVLYGLENRWMMNGPEGVTLTSGAGAACQDLCGNNNLTQANNPTYGSQSIVSWRR